MAVWTGWPTSYDMGLYYRHEPFDYGSENNELDLSDAIMLHWPHAQRTVELRLRVRKIEPEWAWWDEETLKRAEENIRYDLSEDGYRVSILRLIPSEEACDTDMVWKLIVRPV